MKFRTAVSFAVDRRVRPGRGNRPRARQARRQRSPAGAGRRGLPAHGRPRRNRPRLLVLPRRSWPDSRSRRSIPAISRPVPGQASRARAAGLRQGRIAARALQRGRRLGDHLQRRAPARRSASPTRRTARCAISSTSCASAWTSRAWTSTRRAPTARRTGRWRLWTSPTPRTSW